MRAAADRTSLAIDLIMSIIFILFWLYLSVGFFHTDPYAGKMVYILSWAARLGVPLIGVGLVYLYYRIRTGRTPALVAALLFGSIIITTLIAYPVVSSVYYGRFDRKNHDQYHPYLQLAPAAYRPRDEDSAAHPYRILCLGGSTTEFADSDGRGWPARVEERLGVGISGRPVEVHNLGRQWYSTQHTLYNYLTNLRRHRPEMIIVMHAINDLMQNADFSYYSAGVFQADYRHFQGPVHRLIDRPTLLEAAGRVLKKMWYFQPRKIISTDYFPGLASFERNIRTLIEVARMDSVQVVLVTQPCLYRDSMTVEERSALVMIGEAVGPDREWDVQTARRGMEQYNDAIRRLAREEGLLLIDLEKEVPKDLGYFYDDVHYTRNAFDLIGAVIADRLLASLVFTGPSPRR